VNTATEFMARVVVGEDGCWNWTGALSRGYGNLKWRGRTTKAHRVAFLLFRGEFTEGLTLDHLCRNRRCVNPAHLEEVTNRENILRSPTTPTAVNARKTHCVRGHLLSAENLMVNKNGGRRCRSCHRDSQRRSERRYLVEHGVWRKVARQQRLRGGADQRAATYKRSARRPEEL
jgi:hypothetical protein